MIFFANRASLRGSVFLFSRKSIAGLIVLLFVIAPFASIRAEENTEPATPPTSIEEQVNNEPQQTPEVSEPATDPAPDTTDPTVENQNNEPSNTESVTSGNEDKKVDNKLNLGVDSINNFGSLHFNFPVVVPPGRNGQKPNVDLVYDSQSGRINDIFGFGWSSSIPSIERVNQKGIQTLYMNNDIFNSSLDGEIAKVSSGNTEWYGAKSDSGQFLTYQFVSGQYWIVTDKQGTKYTFGYNAAARQDDPGNTSRVNKWMLEEIIDTNGNKISYQYFKDQGQIYPSIITYSNYGQTQGLFEIDFNRQTRSDQPVTRDLDFSVKTAYRINEIVIKVNGFWTKKYSLTYTAGDSGHKSLLDQIIETGREETTSVETTLPATNFDYQARSQGWTLNTSWQVPIGFSQTHKMIDMNGDSLPDLLFYQNSVPVVSLNTGAGWSISTNFPLPSIDIFSNNVQWADVNGDGFQDVISGAENKVYINNGAGTGWTLNQNWTIPYSFSTTTEAVFDINGDNLADIVYYSSTFPDNQYRAYLNTGTQWDYASTWVVPHDFFDSESRIGEINGDGLVDMIYFGASGGNNSEVYINTGTAGWVRDMTWDTPEQFFYANSVVMSDINNDNLSDLIVWNAAWQEPIRRAFINNGHGWEYNSSWEIPQEAVNTNESYINDVNGDAIGDIVSSPGYGGNYKVFIANGEVSDLLITVTNNQGGSTSVEYKGSPEYKYGSTILNPILPINLQTVYLLGENDGFGHYFDTTFDYIDGSYYNGGPFNRKLAGFEQIVGVDDSSITFSYYHQGNATNSSLGEYNDDISKLGRKYRSEVRSLGQAVYSKTINKWDKTDLGNGRSFVKLIQTTNLTLDGNSSHKDKAETYGYDDSNGNQTSITQWGVVDAGNDGNFPDTDTDKFTTALSYASNTSNGVIGLPATETTLDQSSNKVKETYHYYDNLALGQVGNGNETKTQLWRSGTKYIDTEKAYNTYGLVTLEKDPRDKETSYSYDSYNLYPLTATNPLSQITSFTYDYSSGQIKQTTDLNNRVFTTVFDGLDRPIEVKQPDVSNPSSSVTKATYQYTDTANAGRIKQSDYLSGSNIVDIYTYLDGFGRKIQERKESEAANIYNVRDFIYTQHNLLLKESLPYSSNNSARTPATTTTSLFTTYTYDPMQRVLTVVSAVGTTSNAYEDWKTTVTDADGKIKALYRDAYDNLAKVDEHNGTSTYTTTYDWNGLKKLKKITDALGNIRNFSYDGLGRVVSSEDLHAPSDSTFGTWYYSYDSTGNLVSRTDPNNQIVAYDYDDLNRVLTEDYAGASGTEVTYTYDNCTEGIGRLCSASNPSLIVSDVYNALGQVASETKRIGRTNYTSTYEYDRQGNQTLITNPDGSQVKYFYNNAGLANQIQRKETTDTGFINVISSISYNPVNLPITISYGNGAVTTNSYDSNELYRLRTKITSAGSQNVQYLTYTYDPVGNISQIIDSSQTQTAKTTNYTYDDLHRLLTSTISNSAAENVDGPGNGNQTQTFTYDAIGNILSKSDVGTYSYNGNQGNSYANPHAVTSAGGIDYGYDNNGNLISAGSPLSLIPTTYAWDYNNHLTSVTNGDSVFSYAYDASGQRFKSVESAGTSIYLTKEYSVTPQGTEKHIFFSDTAIATISGSNETAVPYLIHADHLAGSSVITDSAQAVDEITDYYSFGSMRIDQQNSSHLEKRKYTGHEFDTDTGLTYANARYYLAQLGRWISEDPILIKFTDEKSIEIIAGQEYNMFLANPQTFNSYSYVANNPLKYTDPLGLFNSEKGLIEKGDNQNIITDAINAKWDVNYSWSQIVSLNSNVISSEDVNINSLVGKTIIPNLGTPDVTFDLTTRMHIYAADGRMSDPIYFMNKVKNKGDLDLKNQKGTVYYKGNGIKNYVFYAQKITKDAPGNILYGYVGSRAGYSDITLHIGAGYAQIMSGNSKWSWIGSRNFGDDPRDSSYINYGIFLNRIGR